MGLYIKKAEGMWDNAIIPYTTDKNLSNDIIQKIEEAIERYHKFTLIRLQKRKGEKHYLRFKLSNSGDNYTRGGCGGYDSRAVTIRLSDNAGTSNIVHEIGHAIGLDHEQQRSDRDKSIEVIEENIRPDEKGNFKIAKGSVTFGDYDYRSIMQYGAYAKAKPWHYQWRKQPNILRTVIIDSEWFVFALNSSTGSVEIRKMKYSRPDSIVFSESWSKNWTSAEFFSIDGNTYLLILKKHNGLVHVHKMEISGSLGEEVFNNGRGWSSDWTIVKTFSLNASSYLFLSKESSGEYQVRQIYRGVKSNGDEFVNFGDNPIHEGNIQGYSIVEFFSISDRNFIFRMNKSNGSVIIQRIGNDASLEDIVYDEKSRWGGGWTTVRFFEFKDEIRVIMLKESSGDIRIHRVLYDDAAGRSGEIRFQDPPEFEVANDWSTFEVGEPIIAKSPNGGTYSTTSSSVSEWRKDWNDIQIFSSNDTDSTSIYFLFSKSLTGDIKIFRAESGDTNFTDAVRMTICTNDPQNQFILGESDNRDIDNNIIQFTETDLKTFLHLYREQIDFRIFEMDTQGRLKAFTERRVMETGWIATKPFFLNEVPYIFRLKELGGQVNIYQLTETGKLKYEDSVWPEKDNLKSGWSTVEFFYLNNETFLFLLKELGGSARIHKMNGDGSIGTEMYDNHGNWQNGWTNAKFCQIGRSMYRILLHKEKGIVRINKLKRNTGVPSVNEIQFDDSPTDELSVERGITCMEIFDNGGSIYLFLYNKSSGYAKIHILVNGGLIGNEMLDKKWKKGWTVIRFVNVGKSTYIFMLNGLTGVNKTHSISLSNTGDAIELSDLPVYEDKKGWNSGWTEVEFCKVKDRIFLICSKSGLQFIDN